MWKKWKSMKCCNVGIYKGTQRASLLREGMALCEILETEVYVQEAGMNEWGRNPKFRVRIELCPDRSTAQSTESPATEAVLAGEPSTEPGST